MLPPLVHSCPDTWSRNEISFLGMGLRFRGSCQEFFFFLQQSTVAFVLDAWSSVCLNIRINEVRGQKTTRFLSPRSPPSSLPFLGHSLLSSSSSSLAALSGRVLECAQFGDQSLSQSLLLHCPWLCEWVCGFKKKKTSSCVCACERFSYKQSSQYKPSLSPCSLGLSGTFSGFHASARGQTPAYTHVQYTHEYINLQWCSFDMTHLTFPC